MKIGDQVVIKRGEFPTNFMVGKIGKIISIVNSNLNLYKVEFEDPERILEDKFIFHFYEYQLIKQDTLINKPLSNFEKVTKFTERLEKQIFSHRIRYFPRKNYYICMNGTKIAFIDIISNYSSLMNCIGFCEDEYDLKFENTFTVKYTRQIFPAGYNDSYNLRLDLIEEKVVFSI